jgi:hypothetical protein
LGLEADPSFLVLRGDFARIPGFGFEEIFDFKGTARFDGDLDGEVDFDLRAFF